MVSSVTHWFNESATWRDHHSSLQQLLIVKMLQPHSQWKILSAGWENEYIWGMIINNTILQSQSQSQSLGLISALRCHAHNSFHWNLFALQLPPDTWSTSAQQVLPLDLCQPRFIHYSLRWPYAELKIQAATSQFFTGQSVLTGKTLECFEIKVSLGEDKWAWRKCLACFHIRIRSKIRRDKRR